VFLLAHGLGGVLAFDLLAHQGMCEVARAWADRPSTPLPFVMRWTDRRRGSLRSSASRTC
jgi:alpha-beta hydrolase superfamily lysophospholipase